MTLDPDATLFDLMAPLAEPQKWGSPIEVETRNRIMVAAAAYAYEIEADPIMSDADFDALAARIRLDQDTTRPDLDAWFRANFAPHTGQWVNAHPDPAGLRKITRAVRRDRMKEPNHG